MSWRTTFPSLEPRGGRSLWLCLGLLTIGGAAYGRPTGATRTLSTSGEARVGDPMPWFAGHRLGGGPPVTRKSLLASNAKGHVVSIFATWCTPCKEGIRELVRNQSRLTQAGIRVTLVNYRETPKQYDPWLKTLRFPADWPVATDKFGVCGDVLAGLGAGGELPRTLVIDRSGRVRAIFGREGADFIDRVVDALR